MSQEQVTWTEFTHANWTFRLAATEEGLCYVDAQADEDALGRWADRHFPGRRLMRDDVALAPYAAQLMEYLHGERRTFELPLVLRGTPFQRAVWQALGLIPYGSTASYTDIAQATGNRKAVRAVGGAVGANPLLIVVPCHRVIGKDGSLTGFSSGMELKEYLLALEGVRPALFPAI